MTLVSNRPSPKRRKGRLLCGAKTRAGGCCQVRAEPGKARCRFHGVKSTGPKTPAGRARIAEAPARLQRREAPGLRLDPLTVTDAILTTAGLLHPTPRQLIFNFANPGFAAGGAARFSNG
jgi:hypothetical protein